MAATASATTVVVHAGYQDRKRKRRKEKKGRGDPLQQW